MNTNFDDIRVTVLSGEFLNEQKSVEDSSILAQKTVLDHNTVFDPNIYSKNSEEISSDYLVTFSKEPQSYCIGMVDMTNSTKIASTLTVGKISRYYQIFLNSMSKILSKFGGVVIKNIGDSLLFYFPESRKSYSKFGFLCCIECSLAMTESRKIINEQLTKEKLPNLNYRISCDFGTVVIMKSSNSFSLDMIGPPVNICSKINHIADANHVIIGGDLYENVKSFKDYHFKSKKSYSVGFDYSYPLYTVKRKTNRCYE